MRKRIVFLGIILSVFLGLSACGSKKETSDNTTGLNPSTITDTSETTGTKEDTKKEENNFTLPDANTRPIAVMIDNEGFKPLPQGGLDKAQLIYEIVVEGGATRLMPVFWNPDIKMLGPVRSARDYFLDYAIEHNAIYIHFGGSPAAYASLKKLKWNDIDGVKGRDGALFWDITNEGSKNWQDSYTNTDKLTKQINKLKYKTTTDKKLVLNYNTSDTELTGTQAANKLSIRYSSDYSCGYTYEPSTKLYLRFRKDKPQIERVTGKQLNAKNIIIQRVKNALITGDDKGRQRLTVTGSGTGWYITNGKAVKLKWKKESRSTQTQYTDEAGNPIMLNPGQTWIQVSPMNSEVKIE